MHVLILFFYFLISPILAQHSEQPLKEASNDLRSQTTLFSIEIPGDKKIFILERTQNMDYFLRLRVKQKDSIRKISSKDGKKVDMDFASRFLKCQYEIPAVKGKCRITLRLKMKGEPQEICQKDKKKSQEILSFVKNLSKRF